MKCSMAAANPGLSEMCQTFQKYSPKGNFGHLNYFSVRCIKKYSTVMLNLTECFKTKGFLPQTSGTTDLLKFLKSALK